MGKQILRTGWFLFFLLTVLFLCPLAANAATTKGLSAVTIYEYNTSVKQSATALDTDSWEADIPGEWYSITVKPTLKSGYTLTCLKYGQREYFFSDGTVDLSIGSSNNNDINMEIILQNSSGDEISCELTLYRHSSLLQALTIKYGSEDITAALLPEFSADEQSYTLDVADEINSVSIAASPEESGAAVRINGVESEKEEIELIPGETVPVSISVTSRTGDTTTYKISISSFAGYEKSNVATLQSMQVYIDDTLYELTPAFTASTNSYTLQVPLDAQKAQFLAAPMDTGATMYLNGVILIAGDKSEAVSLTDVDSGSCTLKVVAEDGATAVAYSVKLSKEAKKTIVLRIDSTRILVNDEENAIDVAPYLGNNRTMVPLRFISEGLGAKVGWNQLTKTVTIKKDGQVLTMVIGQTGEGLDVPPELKNGRTFVPVRYVSEQLGAKVEWVKSSQEIIITQ